MIEKLLQHLNNNLSKPSNWRMYQCLLRVSQIKDMIGRYLRKLHPVKFSDFREDFKFSPLKKKDISTRVAKLQNTLGIDGKLECKLLSERTILIRKL